MVLIFHKYFYSINLVMSYLHIFPSIKILPEYLSPIYTKYIVMFIICYGTL